MLSTGIPLNIRNSGTHGFPQYCIMGEMIFFNLEHFVDCGCEDLHEDSE